MQCPKCRKKGEHRVFTTFDFWYCNSCKIEIDYNPLFEFEVEGNEIGTSVDDVWLDTTGKYWVVVSVNTPHVTLQHGSVCITTKYEWLVSDSGMVKV